MVSVSRSSCSFNSCCWWPDCTESENHGTQIKLTSPAFHPVTIQDLKLISKRCEITTCYQHWLIPEYPDLPSVSVQSHLQSLFFFFFVDVSSFNFQCDISWVGLTLIPPRHTICPGQKRKEALIDHVSTLKTKGKHSTEPFVFT